MPLLFLAPLFLLAGIALSARGRRDSAAPGQLALTSGADHGYVAHRPPAHPYHPAYPAYPAHPPHYAQPHHAPPHHGPYYGSPRYTAPAVPSPLAVFRNLLYSGQPLPPQVILCAIAEAETLGQMALAHQIFQTYVLPVVLERQRAAVASARYAGPDPGYQTAPAYPPAPYGPPADAYAQAPAQDYDYAGDPAYAQAAQDYAQAQSPAGPGYATAPPAQADQATARAYQAVRAQSSPGGGDGVDGASILAQAQAASARGQASTAYEAPETDGPPGDDAPTSAAPTSASGTITVSGKSSPIAGIGTEEWGAFVGRVARELPTFTATNHVGQFRQRRERLSRLGIDPASLVGSPDAQAAALHADMADAHDRAAESGMLDAYLGSVVVVPVSGQLRPIEVTRSGVLGVIQAAGIEGAASWLRNDADRRRFQGTTQAFIRTNGVF